MKKWYESRTIWFNIILTLMLIAQAIGTTYPSTTALTGLIAVIGNIILRVWFTSSGIGVKNGKR